MSIGYAGGIDVASLRQQYIIEESIQKIQIQLNVISTSHCVECGNPIPKERLKVIKTNYCIQCKLFLEDHFNR